MEIELIAAGWVRLRDGQGRLARPEPARADATEPIVHEIKGRCADLLAELKKPDKARARRPSAR